MENNNDYVDISSNTNEDELSSYSQEYQSSNKVEERKLSRKEKKMLEKREREINKHPRRFFKSIWIVMVLIISIAISEFLLIGMVDLLALNRDSDSRVSISIPKDASNKQIADILESAGAIEYDDYFTYYLALFKNDVDFTCGEYDIPLNLDYAGVVGYLQTQTNRTDEFYVTFPEGKNILEYAQILEDNEVCSKEDFLNECNKQKYDDYTFIEDITNDSDRYYKVEGYLFPDTYKVYKDTDPAQIVTSMLNNFESKITSTTSIDGYSEKVNLSQIAEENGMTTDQLITLASLVQAEAADEKDMKIIAGIFLNRLEADQDLGYQYLGSDATVYYPYRTKEEAPSGYQSRYDTYNITGLPPGPICNPGIEAINAVLNPTESNYMYFAHDNEGNAYYATTEAQQQNNLELIEEANG